VYEKLFKAMNKQLEKHEIIVKTGAIVDASIIDTPLKPKGKTTYEIAVDRSEQERTPKEQENEQLTHLLIKKEHPGVDSEARWINKSGKNAVWLQEAPCDRCRRVSARSAYHSGKCE
jgi:IS5 family transposase